MDVPWEEGGGRWRRSALEAEITEREVREREGGRKGKLWRKQLEKNPLMAIC